MFVFDSTDEASYESVKQQFSIYYLVKFCFKNTGNSRLLAI